MLSEAQFLTIIAGEAGRQELRRISLICQRRGMGRPRSEMHPLASLGSLRFQPPSLTNPEVGELPGDNPVMGGEREEKRHRPPIF